MSTSTTKTVASEQDVSSFLELMDAANKLITVWPCLGDKFNDKLEARFSRLYKALPTPDTQFEIVKRYNSWPALLEACKAVLNSVRDDDGVDLTVGTIQQLNSAIRAAEGKAQT